MWSITHVFGINWIHFGTVRLTWTYINGYSIHLFGPTWPAQGFTWTHRTSHEFTWILLGSLGNDWTHLAYFDITWTHLDSLGLVWIHVDRPGYLDSLRFTGAPSRSIIVALNSIKLDSQRFIGLKGVHMCTKWFEWTHMYPLQMKHLELHMM